MASVKTLAGEQLLVKIGNAASPEVFAHDCLINTDRAAAMSAETTEVIVPDCNSPENPAWKQVLKDGLSIQVSGAGILHTASIETWFDWFKSDDAKNVRIELNGVAGADGGGYIAGAFKLTQFSMSGTRKNLATVDVTLVSHGACAWTDAA